MVVRSTRGVAANVDDAQASARLAASNACLRERGVDRDMGAITGERSRDGSGGCMRSWRDLRPIPATTSSAGRSSHAIIGAPTMECAMEPVLYYSPGAAS